MLDLVGPDTHVTVSELVPPLVGWHHDYLGPLADHPLEDDRCEVVVENVLDTIKSANATYDAIILDVDNGPVALSNEDNGQLYTASGVRACHRALRPYGVLAVWSAGPSPKFERTLKNADFEVHVVRVSAREGARAQHVLFIAHRLARPHRR